MLHKKETNDTFVQLNRSPSTGEQKSSGIWSSIKDSFKPALPQDKLTGVDDIPDRELTDIERININAANSNLQRKLKTRHLQMIAIGSSIGTGLFVGTGGALSTGGPAAIVLAWAISAISVFMTMQGLGELAVAFPVSGGFNLYASKF